MGWGKAVKLPSFEILYPRETYEDRLAFALGTMADGTTYYAYHTRPVSPLYNASLKWQYNVMREVGIDVRVKGGNLSLSFFYNTKMGYTLYRNVDKEATEAIPGNEGKLVYSYALGVDGATDPSGIDAEASIRKGARIVYKDTNNSSQDFHLRSKASLRN